MSTTVVRAGLVAVAAGLFFAGSAHAQIPGRLSLEPYAGIHFDNAFRTGIGWSREGAVGGVRLGYAAGERIRWVADLGYLEVDGVGEIGVSPDLFVYGVDQVQTTVGVDWTAIPGRTSAVLGLQTGFVWRTEEIEGAIGDPLPEWDETGGWTPHFVAAPSIALRQALGRRFALDLRIADQLMLSDADVGHSPSITLGLTVR